MEGRPMNTTTLRITGMTFGNLDVYGPVNRAVSASFNSLSLGLRITT